MITQWRLARFKSVQDEAVLAFGKLTLFAGANSSGKSTVLQSVLVTAQTLQSGVESSVIALNGRMTRLGEYRDVVSNGDDAENIAVGFTLQFDGLAPEAHGGIVAVECAFRFGVRGDNADIQQLRPPVQYAQLVASVASRVDSQTDAIEVQRAAASDLATSLTSRTASSSGDARPFEVIRSPAFPRRGDATLGATVIGFLPAAIIVSIDALESETELIFAFLRAPTLRSSRREQATALVDTRLDDESWAAIVDAVRLGVGETEEEGLSPRMARQLSQFLSAPSAERFALLYRGLPAAAAAAYAKRLSDMETALRELVERDIPRQNAIESVALAGPLQDGRSKTRQYFQNAVKYLGPLREDPRPIYSVSAATDPNDVGLRGEYTAAVLNLHRDTPIDWIAPPAAVASEGSAANQTPLLTAVSAWMSYMGVGSSVRTVDRGKFGHELRVSQGVGATDEDLTQIGVGVSQVLPLLVMSLLAPRGTTLVFEQPELHLHPRVQTRLADFFVSLMQAGKQCLIETHSEYMINRLRYLVAASPGSTLANDIQIYFVEKAERRSTYRSVRINAYGVIEDWPKGFFDENEDIAAEVLRAGLAKRRTRPET